MQMCKQRGSNEIGFIDLHIVFKHPKSNPTWKEDTEKNLMKFLAKQRGKKHILFPYNFNDHWILIVIDLQQSHMKILDSMRKSLDQIQDMIDIFQR